MPIKAPPSNPGTSRTPSVLKAIRIPGTPSPGLVPIPDIFPEMYLLFSEHQGNGEGMHRRVPPPLVIKPAFTVQIVEISLVTVRPEEGQGCDFEVGPKMTKVVRGVGMLETQEEGVGDEAEGVLWVQILRVKGEEGLRGGKERWDCGRIFGECECEGV